MDTTLEGGEAGNNEERKADDLRSKKFEEDGRVTRFRRSEILLERVVKPKPLYPSMNRLRKDLRTYLMSSVPSARSTQSATFLCIHSSLPITEASEPWARPSPSLPSRKDAELAYRA
jgi:hypothetical protein